MILFILILCLASNFSNGPLFQIPWLKWSKLYTELLIKFDMQSIHFSEIATVIAAYTATGEEQLSLSPGQLIHVRKKSPSGWWEGELQVGEWILFFIVFLVI